MFCYPLKLILQITTFVVPTDAIIALQKGLLLRKDAKEGGNISATDSPLHYSSPSEVSQGSHLYVNFSVKLVCDGKTEKLHTRTFKILQFLTIGSVLLVSKQWQKNRR